jgi:hypothetical protein
MERTNKKFIKRFQYLEGKAGVRKNHFKPTVWILEEAASKEKKDLIFKFAEKQKSNPLHFLKIKLYMSENENRIKTFFRVELRA